MKSVQRRTQHRTPTHEPIPSTVSILFLAFDLAICQGVVISDQNYKTGFSSE